MAENDVFIEGGNWPDWATDSTLNAILRTSTLDTRLSGESNNILRAILGAVSNNKSTAAMIAAAKKQASAAEKSANANKKIADVQEDAAKTANDTLVNSAAQANKMSSGLFGGLKAMALEMKLAGKTEKEQLSYLKSIDQSQHLTEKEMKDLVKLQGKNGFGDGGLGAVGGSAFSSYSDFLEGTTSSLTDIIGGDSSISKLLGGIAGLGSAAIGALQGARSYATGQIEGRFDMVAEMRQSGLFSAIGEMNKAFDDMSLEVNDNNMTLQEATEFTRQFSHSVGVIGVRESLNFVKTIADGSRVMDDYNLSFGQVATISGTYMETLERLGMLETMNARTRERGMLSFVSVVESTAQTLKVSMEDAAKMISEYLGRDDISAMIMTASSQLSPDMQAQIGQMGNMGPLGEIIAMGAIDPQRFMLTDEYQAMMTPALSGVRGIIEQMQSELAGGGNAADITSRYSQQLADIVRNDPVVGQLVAMDNEVARLVSGIQRFSQTAEDSTNSIVGNVQETDRLERQRQEMLRRKDVTIEQAISSALTNMDLNTLLKSEIGLAEKQIELLTESGAAFENLISGALRTSVSVMNDATALLLDGATLLLEGINEMFPESQSTDHLRVTLSSDAADIIDNALYSFINGFSVSEMQSFLSENQDIANNPQALKYLNAKNQELLAPDVSADLSGQATRSFHNSSIITPSSPVGNLVADQDWYQGWMSQAAEDALSTTFDTALTNSVFNMRRDNGVESVQQITDVEITGIVAAIEDMAASSMSDSSFQTMMTNFIEKMETRQTAAPENTRGDFERLIASLQRFVTAVD